MKCTSVRRRLSLYLDSELGPDTSFAIARHLEGCAPCARRGEGEGKLETLFHAGLGRVDTGERAAWDRALAGALPRRRVPVGGLALVAGAAALSATITFLFARPPRPEPEPVSRSAHAELRDYRLEDFQMKPTSILGAAALVSVASATTTALLMQPEAEPARSAAAPNADLEARIEALLARQKELEDTVAGLRAKARARTEPAPQRAPVISREELERMVAAEIARREEARAGAGVPEPAFDVAAVMRDLLDPNLDEQARRELWESLRASGRIDEVVAAFERRADAAPFDAQARAELGTAYHHKMASVGGGPEAGKWGAKGAAAYEEALELDETHWEARFKLAQHLYYADLPGDSVRHFETLLEQQKDRVSEPHHARAYVWLGNLYVSGGDEEAALEVWRKGAALFPDDAAIADRLNTFDG